MRASYFILWLLASTAIVQSVACGDTKPPPAVVSEVSIVGRWELFQAFRNDRETETLRHTYFEFWPDGTMQTNLPVGAEFPTPYSLEKDIILQQSTPAVTYRILSSSDSLLELSTELRGLSFVLRLQPATPDSSGLYPADSLGMEALPPGDSIE